MKLKLWIAGAIVAIIAVCAVAASAASLASHENAAPQLTEQQMEQQTTQPVCSVSGQIIDFQGNKIMNNPVTLHLIGYDDIGGYESGVWEIYTLTTTTGGEGPEAGTFTFENVIVTPDTKLGYLSSSRQQPDGTVYTGISSNFTVQADASIKSNFVLPVMGDSNIS